MGERGRGLTAYSVCPRCGRIGYRYVEPRGGRKYVYYAHYEPVSRRVRKCYVGPLYSYEHAERLLALGLSNIEDVDLPVVARRAIEEYVERVARWEESARRKALGELLRLRDLLEDRIKLLEEWVKRGESVSH